MKIKIKYLLIFFPLLVILFTGCHNGTQPGDAPMQKRQQLIMFTAPSMATNQDFIDNVYTIDAGGKELKQLTETGKTGAAYFSPSEKKILYSIHYDAAGFLWQLMDSDGQNHQLLTSKPIIPKVKWSPTAGLMLYDEFSPFTNERNLILLETQTGAQKEIPAPPGMADYTITPDGREVWCLTKQAGGNDYELLGQQSGDAKWEKIIETAALPDTIRFAGWSPDGKQLMLSSYEDKRYYLWLAERPNIEHWQLNTPTRWHSGRSPIWKDDGSCVAFMDNKGIWVAEPGKSPRLFWPADNIARLLRWVNDDEVVFQVRNNNKAVIIAKTDGKHKTILATVTPPNPRRQ